MSTLYKLKQEIYPIISQKTNNTVYSGPFKGLKMLPSTHGDICSKLLGLYENELHEALYNTMKWIPDIIVNVGCADGYYGLGLAKLLPNCKTYLIDINQDALLNAINSAKLNNLNNCFFDIQSNPSDVENLIKDYSKPFLVVDIEGHEKEFLDFKNLPSLYKSVVLVEVHDFVDKNIFIDLTNQFMHTHNIKCINQGAKNPFFDLLSDIPDDYKFAICSEGRPSSMRWLWMVPR